MMSQLKDIMRSYFLAPFVAIHSVLIMLKRVLICILQTLFDIPLLLAILIMTYGVPAVLLESRNRLPTGEGPSVAGLLFIVAFTSVMIFIIFRIGAGLINIIVGFVLNFLPNEHIFINCLSTMIDIQNLTDHSWFVSLPSLIRRVLVLPFYIVLLVNKAVMFSYAVFRYSSFLIFPAIYVWLCWENVVKKYNILNGPASYKMLYLIVFIVHIVIVFYFTYLFNERINETATNYKDVYGTKYPALSSSLWV